MKRVLGVLILLLGLSGLVQADVIVFYKGRFKIQGVEAAGKINKKFELYGIRRVTESDNDDEELLLLVFVCKETMTWYVAEAFVYPTSDGKDDYDLAALESTIHCTIFTRTAGISTEVSKATYKLVNLYPEADGDDETLAQRLAFRGWFTKEPSAVPGPAAEDDDDDLSDLGAGSAKGKIVINKKWTKAFLESLPAPEPGPAFSLIDNALEQLLDYLDSEGYEEAECELAP